jgi:hypothetical protein
MIGGNYMPLPKPRLNEKQDEYVSRFMADTLAGNDYPDVKQRVAVAYSEWKRHLAKKFEVFKFDDSEQIVFGWANIAIRKNGQQIQDWQDDLVDVADLEKAAYAFNLEYRDTGEMHKGESVGKMVESFMVTPEKLEKMGLAPDSLPLGWWVGFKIDSPEIFAKVKSGQYSMFSVQGQAKREEV